MVRHKSLVAGKYGDGHHRQWQQPLVPWMVVNVVDVEGCPGHLLVVGSALWVHNIPDAVLMTLACSEHNMRGKSVSNLENEVTEGKGYQVGTGTLVQQLD